MKIAPTYTGSQIKSAPTVADVKFVPAESGFSLRSSKPDTANWTFVDFCSFSGLIPAGGKYFVEMEGALSTHPPDTLTPLATLALTKVPPWLRVPLFANFARMDSACQDVYAELINSSPDAWRDEIAFQVASIDVATLVHHMGNPSLFLENAALVYKYDSLLDYVALVEYGNYTTARYRTSFNGVDTVEIEIPKERYYWGIVHPVIENEAPLYINPRAADPGHNGAGEAPPPVGKFWRDYIFNYPDTSEFTRISTSGTDTILAGFVSPILRDELLGERLLWNGKTNSVTDNGAIGRVSKWIQDVLVFNSGSERPWQPVRIYHMHWGRCGEHADITCAAARSALIPCNSPLAWLNDHTWNEWFDTDWRPFEPVNGYVNFGPYDNWWEMRTCFNARGDGWIWDVVPRYTQYCELTVEVLDADGLPVDGARVKVGSATYTGTWGYTDRNGLVSFALGDSNQYYVKIESDIGNYGAVKIIDYSEPGAHYFWSHKLSGYMPAISVSQDSMEDTTPLYKIEIDYSVHGELIRGQTVFRNELGIKQNWGEPGPLGDIDFFICDAANFGLYESGANFSAFAIAHDAQGSGSGSFIFPSGKWYFVFSNEDAVENSTLLSFSAKLYKNEAYVKEATAVSDLSLAVSPTPFSSFVSIEFALPTAWVVDLCLFDIAGRCVKELIKGAQTPGTHKLTIDAGSLPVGLYFVRLAAHHRTLTRKIIRI